MDNGELNLAWARTLLRELAAGGVRHVCLSPGARSAPLALAAHELSDIVTTVHVDERSAAFFALGSSKATAAPVALVCTSGTAAANYMPAVVEAHHDGVPLVVLTADRPHELRDTGAWQAVDQVNLYGGYVRWFADVAVAGTLPPDVGLRYVRSIGSRAVAEATARPSGPVHLNVPFREPLVPDAASTGAAGLALPQSHGDAAEEAHVAGRSGAFGQSDVSPQPHTHQLRAHAHVDARQMDRLADEVAAEPRGLILAGRLRPPATSEVATEHAAAVARLARATGYPILAEPTGGLRFGSHDRTHVVTGYDALLRAGGWAGGHAPGVVIRFGASFAWRQVAEFVDRSAGVHQIVIDPQNTWDDPLRTGGSRLPVESRHFCDAMAERLPERQSGHAARDGGWLAAWRDAAAIAERERSAAVARAGSAAVGWVYEALPELLPGGVLLQVANSMAVRDLDTFTTSSDSALQVLANRGAAGIDGTLSSGLGAAAASGRPAVVVTGDLAFAHDIGGLAASRWPSRGARIVVLNDGGGGIFEYTALSSATGTAFEDLFLTPSGVDVAAACATYGVDHELVTDEDSLAGAIDGLGQPESGVRVAEIAIDRSANTALHRDYWAGVAAALGG